MAVALPGAVGDPAPAALSWMPAGSRGGGDGALAPSRLSRLGVPIGELHAEEAARADALRTAGRQLEYVAGRVALRRALSLSGCGDREAFGEPLLSTDAGAVRMPLVRERDGESRLLGSISHTRGMCVAIVAGSDDRGRPLVAGAPNRDSDSGEGSSRGGSGGGYSTTRTGAARTALSAADPRKAWPAGLEAECGGGPRAAVGVDVERTDRRPMTKLSLRVLSEPERRDLQVRDIPLCPNTPTQRLATPPAPDANPYRPPRPAPNIFSPLLIWRTGLTHPSSPTPTHVQTSRSSRPPPDSPVDARFSLGAVERLRGSEGGWGVRAAVGN